MLLKLSNLNSNLALTLGYLNPALNNSAQIVKRLEKSEFCFSENILEAFAFHFSKEKG